VIEALLEYGKLAEIKLEITLVGRRLFSARHAAPPAPARRRPRDGARDPGSHARWPPTSAAKPACRSPKSARGKRRALWSSSDNHNGDSDKREHLGSDCSPVSAKRFTRAFRRYILTLPILKRKCLHGASGEKPRFLFHRISQNNSVTSYASQNKNEDET
jgi:hypothetical protein